MKSAKPSISVLVVEDDTALTSLLQYNLTAAGYGVVTTPSAEEAELLLDEQTFELLVLDWMLPGITGIELCGRIRRSGKFAALPILMLTARGEEADMVRGLSTGADDYVIKPFSVPEMLARVKSLLRRSAPERVADTLSVGGIGLDRSSHKVTRNGRTISVGPTEFRLLEVFMESAGRVLTRSQLLDRVWGNTAEIDDRTVDVHVGRLRKALVRGTETDPIRTVRGAGYVME